MNQPEARLSSHPAQRVDRSKPVHFTLDGRRVAAFAGETVAAALYAAGQRILSRSFKYHRPRGLHCMAGRCPNCLLTVDGVPNVRTCVQEVRDGMTVRSQHAWPSLNFDLFAVLDRLGWFLPVGFYYKTFIHPAWAWPFYEKVLRFFTGLGRMDPTRHLPREGERLHLHADIAVVGGGPAGMAAALEGARFGADVVLIDDQPALGGHLQWHLIGSEASSKPDYELGRALANEVTAQRNIRVFTGASAFGLYQGGLLGVAQGKRMIRVRAGQVVVATGGFQHSLVFHNNDLPGVFLADGLQRLLVLNGIRPGNRVLVVTNSDRGFRAARELAAAGLSVVAVADTRSDRGGATAISTTQGDRITYLPAHSILEARGRRHVEGAVVVRLDPAGKPVSGSEQTISCDLIALAAGWEPAAALAAHAGAQLKYREELGAFIPEELPPGLHTAGEVNGVTGLYAVQRDGRLAGLHALAAAGRGDPAEIARLVQELGGRAASAVPGASVRPFSDVPHAGEKRFVCLCEDVTEKDLAQAIEEGFDHIETLKRYSTVTMGPCQGKMCHINSIGICAAHTGRSVADTGRTTARPPAQPIPLGVLAGPHHEPIRRTPLHHIHGKAGATWMDMGAWKRPAVYTTVEAETRLVHDGVGIIDVGTLGKLDVKGADAAGFLDWIHSNRISTLPVGRTRYRLMLDDAGVILDDGTVARLGDQHFYVTTGTGTLETVEQWLDWWLADGSRCVHVTDVTSAYAAINVAGPKSRALLSRISQADLDNEAAPYLAAVQTDVAGVPTLLLRIGFLGELGYEVHFPAEYGAYLWDVLLSEGREFGAAPFGVEAQRVLRLEKSHIIPGHDTDAASNPFEADLAWSVKLEKPDFIGRAALVGIEKRAPRQQLVRFRMADRVVPGEGDAVVAAGVPVGRVTSSKWSAQLESSIGLAWVPAELAQNGRRFDVQVNGRLRVAEIVREPFYDPSGLKLRS
ncbi:MAG: (2Fe-2S)-binding protein [Gemmatimonadetes bacterium]|nr:(2Fe-2S)-binding protein [Gemmatimonadota bacterium]